MIEIADNTLKSLLNNVYLNGTGTHYISQCPFCKKDEHFYLQRKTKRTNNRGQNVSYMWECKHCGENGMIYKLLRHLDKMSLVKYGMSIDHNAVLKSALKDASQELDLTTTHQEPPVGYRRIYESDYLEQSRGFINEHFNHYYIGETKLLPSLKNYSVFLVMEDNDCKGYVARAKYSKEYIKLHNLLRWQNSATDFAKLVFGLDEIVVGKTKTVIIVEGVTSKANIDKLLNLFGNNEVKCVCTFGKKISQWQIAKLQKKGIEHAILLYDHDAIEQIKKYAFELSKYFQTEIGFIKDPEKDPGNLNIEELWVILDHLENPLTFALNKVQKKIL